VVRDPFENGRSGRFLSRVRRRLLAFDSWLDTFFYGVLRGIGLAFSAYSARLERLNVRGPRRLVSEVTSDAMTFGTLGAVLMLALAVPAFEETGDDWLATHQYSVIFLDRYGNEIGKRGILHNDTVPLEEIPDHMIKATLATEDRRFYEHFGIDFLGTGRALMENLRARTVVQGGSSISQQLAKNIFLSNERTIERKIKEAFLALWLESNLTKNEILKLYLDRAYLGGGTFGVDAAAQFYFDKSVRDISLAEAAMIAGLFKAPGRFAPHIDLPAARGRANQVLLNMVEAGFMTAGQIQVARRSPATPIDRTGTTSPDYFLDWAFEEVQRILDGREFVVVAKTTLDPGLQEAAETSIESHLRQYGNEMGVTQAGLVSMELGGAVRSLVGGRDYGESQFNRAVRAQRQPGSSFKGYVYITALMNGYTPDSIVPDAPINIGGWAPRNYGRSYAGPVSLTTALARSINTVPVRLAQSVGRDKIIETAAALGVRTPLRSSRPLPLGVSEMTVMDQAAGYGAFANGGYRMDPYAITEIRNLAGEVLYSHDRDGPERVRAIPPDKAEEMNRMLHAVNTSGTGRRALIDGVPTAGKTGTSQAHRDAWYVGYTGNLVTSVWMGNDDFRPTRRLTGGQLPAMAWQHYMSHAHQGIDLRPIPGVGGIPDIAPDLVAEGMAGEGAETDSAGRPLSLSNRSAQLLSDIERRIREAPQLRAPEPPTGPVSLFRGQPIERFVTGARPDTGEEGPAMAGRPAPLAAE
jgi:penicillin-binding protein 1A